MMLSLTKCHRLLFAVLQYPTSDLATDSSSRLYENPFPCMPHLSFRHRIVSFFFSFPSLPIRTNHYLSAFYVLGVPRTAPSFTQPSAVRGSSIYSAPLGNLAFFTSFRINSGDFRVNSPSSRLLLKTPQTAAACLK